MINAGYVWRRGFPTKANPDVFAMQLAALRDSSGNVDVETVLNAQRPADAPLHDDIVWDDAIAAHQYRLGYVQDALAALRVIPVNVRTEEPLPPIRAMVPVGKAQREIIGKYAQEVTDDDETAELPPMRTYSFVVNMIDDHDETGAMQRMRAEAMEQVKRLAQRFATLPGCEDIALKLNGILATL